MVARRGPAAKWSRAHATAGMASAAGMHSSRISQSPLSTGAVQEASQLVPRRHADSLAQEILSMMAGKDGLNDLDNADEQSDDDEDGSERDHYFSD